MGAVLFRNGRLFDGVGPEARDGVEVLVEGTRIKEVSDRPIRSTSAAAIDLGGRTLMPGLIDAHWHINAADVDLSRLDGMAVTKRAQWARVYLEAALDRGFTTIRDVGGAEHGIAQAVEEGLIKGPRVIYGGPAFSQTGGHGDMRPMRHFEGCACCYSGSLTKVVDGPHALRAAIREEFRKGAHHIKIMGSGGVASPTDPLEHSQYSDEEILAAVDEARRHGSYVAAHCHPAAAIRRCAELGVRSIEHGTLIDAETAAVVAKRGAFVVPTLVILHTLIEDGARLGLPQVSLDKLARTADHGLRSLSIMKAAGVTMGFGTDLLGELHPQQSREFRIRAEVLSPPEILRSATAVNAELMLRAGELGMVAPGAIADLIVIDGNPLRDVTLLDGQGENVPIVMKDGNFHRNRL